MKKYKWWLKQEISEIFWRAEIDDNLNIQGANLIFDKIDDAIDQIDEPEITFEQAHDKLREESILSEKSFDYYWNCIADNVEIDEPGNILVPKQDKSVIPKFVADFIRATKPNNSLRLAFEYIAQQKIDNYDDELALWVEEGNSELFARAWLDGYEVEKEKKYYVAFEDINLLYVTRVEVYGENGKLNYSSESSTENAMEFIDKEKASSLAYFLGAIVVELTE